MVQAHNRQAWRMETNSKKKLGCFLLAALAHSLVLTFSQLNPMVGAAFMYWSNLRRYSAVVFPEESRPSMAQWNEMACGRCSVSVASFSLATLPPILDAAFPFT